MPRNTLWLFIMVLFAYISTLNVPAYENALMAGALLVASLQYWRLIKALIGLVSFHIYKPNQIWSSGAEWLSYAIIMMSITRFTSTENMLVFAYILPWFISATVVFAVNVLLYNNVIQYSYIEDDGEEEDE